MKSEAARAAQLHQQTHCNNCTCEISKGKVNRLCKFCSELQASGNLDGFASRRSIIMQQRENAMKELVSPKAALVRTSHVRTSISGSGGVRTVEKNKATGEINIVQFGGDSELLNMCKYVASGSLPSFAAPDAKFEEVVALVVDYAQAILDEAFKRDMQASEEKDSDKEAGKSEIGEDVGFAPAIKA